MLRSSFLVLAFAVAATACVADQGDNAVLILNNQSPQAGCILTADLGTGFRSAGLMDLSLWRVGQVPFGYEMTPLVENFAVADVANLELVKRRTAIVEGAHIDITFNTTFLSDSDIAALDSAGVLRFDARFSGAIMPNQGLSTFGFQAVPAAVFDTIKAKYLPLEVQPDASIPTVDMLVKVVLFGSINDGQFESEPFTYPVTTCDGCLTNNLGPCDQLSPSVMPRTGGACVLSQDEVVDCCTDAMGFFVCPAVGTGTGA